MLRNLQRQWESWRGTELPPQAHRGRRGEDEAGARTSASRRARRPAPPAGGPGQEKGPCAQGRRVPERPRVCGVRRHPPRLSPPSVRGTRTPPSWAVVGVHGHPRCKTPSAGPTHTAGSASVTSVVRVMRLSSTLWFPLASSHPSGCSKTLLPRGSISSHLAPHLSQARSDHPAFYNGGWHRKSPAHGHVCAGAQPHPPVGCCRWWLSHHRGRVEWLGQRQPPPTPPPALQSLKYSLAGLSQSSPLTTLWASL